jgi:thioredoxin 1
MTIEISDRSFEKEVLSTKAKVVLVDFWAPWCRPCKLLTPILDEIGQELGNKIKIAKLNVSDNPQVAGRLGVMGLPTLMVFKNGRQVARRVGFQSKEQLLMWLADIYKKQARSIRKNVSGAKDKGR